MDPVLFTTTTSCTGTHTGNIIVSATRNCTLVAASFALVYNGQFSFCPLASGEASASRLCRRVDRSQVYRVRQRFLSTSSKHKIYAAKLGSHFFQSFRRFQCDAMNNRGLKCVRVRPSHLRHSLVQVYLLLRKHFRDNNQALRLSIVLHFARYMYLLAHTPQTRHFIWAGSDLSSVAWRFRSFHSVPLRITLAHNRQLYFIWQMKKMCMALTVAFLPRDSIL